MNRPLRRVAFAVLFLFGALLARANWVQVVDGDEYANNPRNSRVLLSTYEQERGPISVLTGAGQDPIARSEDTGGRLRYLRTRVTVSTLVVTVHEREPLVGSTPSENVLLEALRQAWRNFVGLLAGTIAALGVLLPVGVVGVLAWRLWRRRGR